MDYAFVKTALSKELLIWFAYITILNLKNQILTSCRQYNLGDIKCVCVSVNKSSSFNISETIWALGLWDISSASFYLIVSYIYFSVNNNF